MERKKRKGGHNCSVYGCKSGYVDGTPTHGLPTDPRLKDKWLQLITRASPSYYPAIIPSVTTRICSHHFSPTCYSHSQELQSILSTKWTRQRLLPGAVPTLARPTEVSSLGGIQVYSNGNFKLPSKAMAYVTMILLIMFIK